jgi:hypothetical protein
MPSPKRPTGYYYYASGNPVHLALDEEWLALDSQRYASVEERPRVRAASLKSSRPLRGDLILVKRDAIPADHLDELINTGAAQPVFRSDGAMMIALPEIRVEEPSRNGQRAVRRWLRDHGDVMQVVEDAGEKIVLKPTSGRGIDAINLANDLIEKIGPELAQPRFLRVVEHFGATF